MALLQTAEDILRDEFGLKEENYMKVERERMVNLIENFNDIDDEIDDLKYEIRNLEDERDDLQEQIDNLTDELEEAKKTIKELEAK